MVYSKSKGEFMNYTYLMHKEFDFKIERITLTMHNQVVVIEAFNYFLWSIKNKSKGKAAPEWQFKAVKKDHESRANFDTCVGIESTKPQARDVFI